MSEGSTSLPQVEVVDGSEISIPDSGKVTMRPDALIQFRESWFLCTKEQMEQGLQEYSDLRNTFRNWLMAQLKEGVHYGHPPGCVPQKDQNGNYVTGGRTRLTYTDKQWSHPPSLYGAGASFICDLMMWTPQIGVYREMYEMITIERPMLWRQCDLIDTQRRVVATGYGCHILGDDPNKSLKVANKRALVEAVFNALALRDLFTQDLEDMPPPANVAPPPEPTAPKAPAPRDEAVSRDELNAVFQEYCSWMGTSANKDSQEGFVSFVAHVIPEMDGRVLDASAWTSGHVESILTEIASRKQEDAQ